MAIAGLLILAALSSADAKMHAWDEAHVSVEELFNRSAAVIQKFYIHPVSDSQLLEHAIYGMVAKLDPHSAYLNPHDYQELLASTKGEFVGVGLAVDQDPHQRLLLHPLIDSPAAQAGIKEGDCLLAINHQDISAMPLREVVTKMHGPQDSVVDLTVLHHDAAAPVTLAVTRKVLHGAGVFARLYVKHWGYVKINQFQDNTAAEVHHALDLLNLDSHAALQGLIIDLRDNPGGLLDAATDVLQCFLEPSKLSQYHKLLVTSLGRHEHASFKVYAHEHDMLHNLPILVLINAGSASAAEIVAAALQDYHRALIVGQPSFGKGSVQEVISLDQQHALKLTTALYYTPAGRMIQNIGVHPDVLIPQDIHNTAVPGVTEAQLAHHLGNAPLVSHGDEQEFMALMANDYQLFQALAWLQAIAHYHPNE